MLMEAASNGTCGFEARVRVSSISVMVDGVERGSLGARQKFGTDGISDSTDCLLWRTGNNDDL